MDGTQSQHHVEDEAPPPTLFNASGTHVRPNTTSRHRQFMHWLIDRFGSEFLASGTGILDVAGGAGGLAFELGFRKQIPCVVVDPRQMRLNPRQRRALAYEHERSASRQEEQLGPPAPYLAAAAPAVSEGDTCEHEQGAPLQQPEQPTGTPAVPPDYAAAWAEYGLPIRCAPRQLQTTFELGFATNAQTAPLWQSCSVVVGMHPDQATEPIVREALKHGKPFAVVPCCTFPNSNSHRWVNGARVRTHEQFCDYLQGLGNTDCQRAMERSYLLFAGRNVIVHSERVKSSDGCAEDGQPEPPMGRCRLTVKP